MHHNAIRRRVFEHIQKLFPEEFKNATILSSREDIFNASLDALSIVGVRIDDYKGGMAQISEAIDKAINEQKLNCVEIDYLEREILTLIDDMEINLNAEYKSSILELNEEAKSVTQILNLILSSLGEAIKEIILGKRKLTFKEIIAACEGNFHIDSSVDEEQNFWLLKDLFLNRINFIKQYLTNLCDTSSFTMSASYNDAGKIILEYKGTLDKSKSELEIANILNSLLHYKLRYLNKIDNVEYEAKDTENHLILTLTLQS